MSTRLVLFSFLVPFLLSGCAGSRRAATLPNTLQAINEQLEGRWAAIMLTTGETLAHVENVYIDPDSTRYTPRLRATPERQALPTHQVQRVTAGTDRGTGRGLLIGSTPGLLIAGWMGLYLLDEGGEGWGGLIAGTGLMFGRALAAAGGLAGAVIGSAVKKGKQVTVYESPVARYLQNEAPSWEPRY